MKVANASERIGTPYDSRVATFLNLSGLGRANRRATDSARSPNTLTPNRSDCKIRSCVRALQCRQTNRRIGSSDTEQIALTVVPARSFLVALVTIETLVARHAAAFRYSSIEVISIARNATT